jgi:APA family basic amino acid/polyamine antiporter
MQDQRQTRTNRDITLSRALGPLEATTIVLGGMIGSGIFIAPTIVARDVGAPGLSLAVWIGSGLLATCGALCYAELAGAIPETGGTYSYLKRIYDVKLIAFLFGWTTFFAISAGTIAASGAAFAAYSEYFLGSVFPSGPWTVRLIAAGCILFLAGLNCLGTGVVGQIQNLLTFIKVASLLGVIFACAFFGHGQLSHFEPLLPEGRNAISTVEAFGTAMIPALFAYEGWTFSANVAGEIKHPRRSVPLSIILGIGLAVVLYLAANLAYMYVIPFDELRKSKMLAADVLERIVGRKGGGLISMAVVISTFGGINTLLLTYPRIQYAMAKDGLFFEWMGSIHPRFRTPARSILTQGALAASFALSGTYEQILGYIAFCQYLFLALAVVGLMVLRYKDPTLHRPYRVSAYPLTPILFSVTCFWYLLTVLIYRFRETVVGLIVMLLGIPFYFYWRRKASKKQEGARIA